MEQAISISCPAETAPNLCEAILQSESNQFAASAIIPSVKINCNRWKVYSGKYTLERIETILERSSGWTEVIIIPPFSLKREPLIWKSRINGMLTAKNHKKTFSHSWHASEKNCRVKVCVRSISSVTRSKSSS